MGVEKLHSFLEECDLWKDIDLYFPNSLLLMYSPEGTLVVIDCDNIINHFYRLMCESGDFDLVITNDAIEAEIIKLRDYLEYHKLKVVSLCCDCTNEYGKLEKLVERSIRKQKAIRCWNDYYLATPTDPTNRRYRKISFPSVVRWKFITAFEKVFGLPLHHKGRNVDGYVQNNTYDNNVIVNSL